MIVLDIPKTLHRAWLRTSSGAAFVCIRLAASGPAPSSRWEPGHGDGGSGEIDAGTIPTTPLALADAGPEPGMVRAPRADRTTSKDRSERMAKLLQVLLAGALLLLAVGVTVSWYDQPRRTTERFVGNMYHERYEDAAGMLHPPSALTVESDGALVIVDRNGRSISVPGDQLPFMAGGHDGDQAHDFKMTALGPSTDGILHDPPVTLYLSLVGGEVAIEAIKK